MPYLNIQNSGDIANWVDVVLVTEKATLNLPTAVYDGKRVQIINSVSGGKASDAAINDSSYITVKSA